jgi:biopolymer transport protein ExbD
MPLYRSHTRDPGATTSLNITPMIDLVFILLVFFAVNASFVKEPGVEVDRPNARTSMPQDQASILVAVTAEGEIWLDRRRVDIRALRAEVERLRAENPEGSAVVVADTAAEAGLVVRAMDQIRLAGVERVAIATAPGQ